MRVPRIFPYRKGQDGPDMNNSCPFQIASVHEDFPTVVRSSAHGTHTQIRTPLRQLAHVTHTRDTHAATAALFSPVSIPFFPRHTLHFCYFLVIVVHILFKIRPRAGHTRNWKGVYKRHKPLSFTQHLLFITRRYSDCRSFIVP